KKDYDAKTEVTIYSRIILEADGKFHLYQSGDYIDLDTDGAVWTKNDLIWVPLTWNLVRGEDYGRGLVADYSGAFHAVNILTGALLNIAAIIGDIKFLVNPASVVDVTEMNAAKPGSYHSGKEGDITTVKIEKTMDAQFIGTMIERYEKQIAQAFLLGSQLTRNAERVTAEEIRASANELETSNGGIYSRLAATWQVQTANIVLAQINFVGVQNGIKPQIITGLDSLSRAGELDNIRLWLGDMALLNVVPEDVREWLKVGEFMEVIGTNRQVEYKRFTMTEAEHDEVVRRRREAEAAAMQAEQAAKGQGAVQAAAMKQG
ncbi:MAG: portal protein, partial [Sneathiella sp.]